MRPISYTFTATAAGSSNWLPVDAYVPNAIYGLKVTSTGAGCQVEGTYDNVFATTTPYGFVLSTAFQALTTTTAGAVTLPVRAFRITASAAGTFGLVITQQGTQ